MKKLTAIFLILSLLFSGCTIPEESAAENLAENVPARVVCLAESPDCAETVTDIALELLRRSYREGENTLLSPLSILAALGMTANGAEGNTLDQITGSLGLTRDELNAWVYSYPNGQLQLANSLWLRDDGTLEVEPAFLEVNADFYQADVFKTTFGSDALSQINAWVAEKTENRIPRILDSVPENAMVYLINALTFEGDWEESYEPYQLREGRFLTESGAERDVLFMNSTENAYLETDYATGFLKYYQNRDYAFAALLPREGVTVARLLEALDGAALHSLLSAPQEAEVKASLPKFETEYSAELSEVLKIMGITDAFDPASADFSALGKSEAGNLYISQVLHKSAITVAEEGTTAAAATVVEMLVGGAYLPDLKFVTLDRPFVYMLIDCRENTPFFIGTMLDPSGASPAMETPPRLQALLDGQLLSLDAGNFQWSVPDGQLNKTILACGAAPMDYAGKEPMLITDAETATFFWQPDAAPQSLEITLWDPETGEITALTMEEDTLDIRGVSGIFQITARWEDLGIAEYILTLARP